MVKMYATENLTRAYIIQIRDLDELAYLVQHLDHGPLRVDALNRYAWMLRGVENHKAFHLAQQSHALAEELNYPLGVGYANLILGNFEYLSNTNLAKGLEWTISALDIFEAEEEYTGAATALISMAVIYWTGGEYDRAFQHLNRGSEIFEKHPLPEGQSWGYYMRGSFLLQLKEFENAMEALREARVLFDQVGDRMGIATSLAAMANVCQGLGDVEKAIALLKESIGMAQEDQLIPMEARGIHDMGMIHLAQGRYHQALQALAESLRLRESINNRQGIISSQTHLGQALAAVGDYQNAETYLNKAEERAREFKLKSKLLDIYENKVALYKKSGEPWKALEVVELLMGLKTEVMGEEATNKVKSLQAVWEIEKAQQATEVEREKNRELQEAYLQIERQTRDIMASIRYAKRIQQAIMVPVRELEQHFVEAFVFYRPKDVVSGDFYWYGRQGNRHILAAIDCTGHGVPGAFMVVMANSLLNEIVNDLHMTDPHIILEELDRRLHSTLRRNGQENQTNDGMDISLVSIDEAAGMLHFAGAKNPLVYSRNGEQHVIKGGRYAIGGHELVRNKGFATFSMAMEPGDTYYLYSDGFQDQFGGNEGRKYMSRRFRYLLQKLGNYTMAEQGRQLDQELSTWKGTCAQTDDVLVIGLKVGPNGKLLAVA